jgi:hypothetical protein
VVPYSDRKAEKGADISITKNDMDTKINGLTLQMILIAILNI